MSNHYYSYRVTCLDTEARLRHFPAGTELIGVHCGPPVTTAELINKCGVDESAVEMTVEDNGEDGDGVCLDFFVPTRPDGDEASRLVFAIQLSLDQTRMLIAALQGVVTMRTAEAATR